MAKLGQRSAENPYFKGVWGSISAKWEECFLTVNSARQ
ncbi:hypothetical protein Z948_2808 [Sulfitobacter donghicola DSW-25 = KCTC 12864 = JCM 14565]|nr:hypothetical protein Z948_2808 [Sulfitobacter donghicola DSW-25 = KCTC 12864 = JCM 14565]